MKTVDFILDLLDRVQQELTKAVDSLTDEEMAWRPGPGANSIGFVLWHQMRCEDQMVHAWIQGETQSWVSEQWFRKLNLPDDPGKDGYGYTAEQVAAFLVPPLKDLLDYGAAVRIRTVQYLKNLAPEELDRVVHIEPLPEVDKVSELFSSLLVEIALHVGQIAYLRGLQRGIDK